MNKLIAVALLMVYGSVHAVITQEQVDAWAAQRSKYALHRAVYDGDERRVGALLSIRSSYAFTRDPFDQLPLDVAFSCYEATRDELMRTRYGRILVILSPKA